MRDVWNDVQRSLDGGHHWSTGQVPTAETLSVDVCSNCHPAYTGVQRAVATGNRVERFNRRRSLAAA